MLRCMKKQVSNLKKEMSKQVLIETRNFTTKRSPILEVRNQGGQTMVEGILATAEVKNGNGRYYSRDIWEREMDKYQEAIQGNKAIGELDHPETGVINLQNVSHKINEAHWEGDDIIGTIEILGTPSGNILKELLRAGVTVGVSSRGEGSVQQVGEVLQVQDDFNLIAWDFVSTPSNPGSYMNVVSLNESLKSPNNFDKYKEVNKLVQEILCSNGQCLIL